MIVLLHCRRSVPRQKWHWRSFRVTILIWPKLVNLSLTKEWVKRSGEHSLIQFLFRWNRFPFQAHMWGRFTRRRPVWFPLFWDPVEIFDPGRFFVFSSEAEYGITGGRKRKFMFGNSTQTIWQKSPLSHTGLTRAKLFWERRDFSVFSFLAVFLFLFRLFSFQFQKFWTWSW